jgi:hypothetical protein
MGKEKKGKERYMPAREKGGCAASRPAVVHGDPNIASLRNGALGVGGWHCGIDIQYAAGPRCL